MQILLSSHLPVNTDFLITKLISPLFKEKVEFWEEVKNNLLSLYFMQVWKNIRLKKMFPEKRGSSKNLTF